VDKPLQQPSMYTPPHYAAADPAAIVRAYPFALLVTPAEHGTFATSTPIFFESDTDTSTLVGHMAGRNPHAAALEAGQPALAVFWGPHAYISSRWYKAMPQVPTWNYLQAQVRGVLEPIDDREGRVAVLRRTAEVLERKGDPPWTLEQAPDGRIDALLPHIRSFRIHVDKIEGATKLSQKHPASDRLRVVEGLLAAGDSDAVEIARLMAALGIDDA
jgi:transcriptional regulator